ncbi:MAG TPA: fumarylacetoacetate hydrolase family protein [Ensifer sp.]|nr:fumarylacetoacetate hydrolase family protein [Ensifer sp.]
MKISTILIDGCPELALALPVREAFVLYPVRQAAGLAGMNLPETFTHPDDPLRAVLMSGDRDIDMLRRMADHCARALRNGSLAGDTLLAENDAHYLPPITRPGKILAAGRNYHRPGAAKVETSEAGPPIFAKFPSTMVGHGQPVHYPRETRKLDYEVELAVVIGKRCRDLAPEEALDVVAGYTIFNDLTMSDIQKNEIQKGLMLFGKNADCSGPCGPWLVTRDEIADPDNLRLSLTVGGERRQDDSTASMVFDTRSLIAYCSRIELHPGDIILTGTPAGTAAQSQDADNLFLKPGDLMDCWVEKVGRLSNPVVA